MGLFCSPRRLAPILAVALLPLVAVALLSRCAPGAAPAARQPRVLRADLPLIVLDAPDADAWVRLERASGASARVGTLGELVARRAGIVPGGARLSSADHTLLHRWVQVDGGWLVTPHADLLAGLGLARGATEAISSAPIPGSDTPAQFASPIKVAGLEKGRGLTSLQPLIRQGDTTLVGEAVLGAGKVLALAFDPLASNWSGYEFLPTLGRDVAAWTQAPAGPQRTGLEVYFDPGTLPPELKNNPTAIAERLSGARAVQIAGWNFGFRDPANDFDYAGLIAALHARGILAYAWLEPPFVNLLMWEDHPECREKTATGRDAMVDWRALIALEDPRCFDLAWAQWEPFLKQFDWDGINVAELYFEPDIRQDNFTPFHPSALKLFGKDPATNPEAFKDFRTDLVVTLNDQFLTRLNSLPRAADLAFELTVIDNRLDPEHGRDVGSDVQRLAAVAKRGGAALQVEDPFTTWTEGPLRYDALVPQVVPLMPQGDAFLDINVVGREGAAPTSAMTGAELDLAAMSAGRANGRLAIFSVATVGSTDLAHLPAAITGSTETMDTGVKAETSVVVRSPHGVTDTRLSVDGVAWPATPCQAIVPAGEHRLDWSAGPAAGPGLVRLTGELGTASVEANALAFSYDSRSRTYAVIDRKPLTLTIDGASADLQVTDNPGGGFTIVLPPGTHTVRIATD